MAWMRVYATMASLGWLAGVALAATDTGESLAVWAVDPHVKVFRDTRPAEARGEVTLRAARNEYEAGQVALRSATPLKGVRIELSPLRLSDGTASLGLDHIAANLVGFIPLKKNTHDSQGVWIRSAPCEVPDVLLESRTLDVPAESTQPVWLTVYVPKDAALDQLLGTPDRLPALGPELLG